MKTYDERANGVAQRIIKKKKQEKRISAMIITGSICLALLVSALFLFIPYNADPPDVSMYADSPYYELIQSINKATYDPPEYKNNFEMLMGGLSDITKGEIMNGGMDAMPNSPGAAEGDIPNEDNGTNGTNGSYVEVTDNQVHGVIEADIFKRSDQYVFHLNSRDVLNVYSIAGEDSQLVGYYDLAQGNDGYIFDSYYNAGMFLSQDCTTVTIITAAYEKIDDSSGKYSCLAVLNLDVTDPANITRSGLTFITGSYKSARMVDGKLLMLSNYYINQNMDFADESSYLPMVGTPGNMQCIAAEDIAFPTELSSTSYTVACLLDGKTLEVVDSAAFLSFSDEVYVSENAIYATRTYTEEDERGYNVRMSQISCLRYDGNGLEHAGSARVKGSVKNQYSMDEHEGILRVVTSTWEQEITNGLFENVTSASNIRNASLYCIDLKDFAIIASVESFAPEGESAESVRFDGNYAYVCTAEVIVLTDPVYFFDLTDLQNITYKDTGTIDGYSSSLVNFGDGFLLGIGYGSQRELKIEVYVETQNGVESLCSFEELASFSEDYKSYFIDRENGYVGLGVYSWDRGTTEYVLLHFDGYNLREVQRLEVPCSEQLMRAFIADGYLYVLGHELQVSPL